MATNKRRVFVSASNTNTTTPTIPAATPGIPALPVITQPHQHLAPASTPVINQTLQQQQMPVAAGTPVINQSQQMMGGNMNVNVAAPAAPQASEYNPPARNEFMRMTINAVPQTPQLLQKLAIPLGCVIHPMNSNEPLPVIDFGSVGVIRCKRCRSYINPFVQFLEGGRRWKCNLCGLPNDVSNHYFSPLKDSGVRKDINERPELLYSSVEFVASAEYMARPPQPPCYFFVIDVSVTAVSSGQLATACSTILSTLKAFPEDSQAKVGFITFDSKCHLYHLRSKSAKPYIMVMNPVDKIPVPSGYEFLVILKNALPVITTLLTDLPKIYAQNKEVRSCLGPALRTAYILQKSIGGKLLVFSTLLPTVGIGKLEPRFDKKLLQTEKEVTLLRPQNEYYKKMALKYSKHHICVDLFIFSRENQAPYDLPSLGQLCEITGGQLFFYPNYGNYGLDSFKYTMDLWNDLTRETGYEAVMRVRCSQGVAAVHHHGNLFVRSTDLLALPNIDPSKAFALQLNITEDLGTTISTIGPNVTIQAALLYTTSNSERRIRVMTTSVPIVNNLSTIYSTADEEAIVNLVTKMAIQKALANKLTDAKEAMFNKLVDILSAYRQINPSAASLVQFPPSLQLLPLYFLGCIKSIIFRGGIISPDQRSAYIQLFRIFPIEQSCMFLCPRLMALHNMPEECGYYTEDGGLELPPLINLSSEKLDRSGIYLMDNGQFLLLRFSKQVDPETINQIFGTPDINQISFPQVIIQNNPEQPETSLLNRIANIITYLQTDKIYYPRLYVVKEGEPLDSTFLNYLVEDRNNAESYQEFLIKLQRSLK